MKTQQDFGYGAVFATIDGKIVQYTEAKETLAQSGSWDDYVYLGEGEFHHLEKSNYTGMYKGD